MFQLNFTSRVLGKHAANALRHREVTQTIISGDMWGTAIEGRVIIISLDGELLGRATISAIERLPDGCGLSADDAERGGFENMKEFFNALYRAGYLFPELNRYDLYRVKFTWI